MSCVNLHTHTHTHTHIHQLLNKFNLDSYGLIRALRNCVSEYIMYLIVILIIENQYFT